MIRWLASIGLTVAVMCSPVHAIIAAVVCALVWTWGLMRLLEGGVW